MDITALLGVLSGLLFFALHVTTASSFPRPLSSAEEKECFTAIKNGDEKARGTLIEHNLRLVAHIVKKYYGASYEQDDLISIGTIGLIKATMTFDSEKGARFATYASKCIENEILMYFRGKRKSALDVSISEPIDSDKDGNSLTFMDVMADESFICEDIETKLRCEKLYEHIASDLGQRERKIISLRYGLGGKRPLTQREVAEKLGISRSYVSRIEKKTMETLKKGLAGQE